jgi:hypothetical protein
MEKGPVTHIINCPCRLTASRCHSHLLRSTLMVQPALEGHILNKFVYHGLLLPFLTLSCFPIKVPVSLDGTSMSTTHRPTIFPKEANIIQMVTRAYYENEEPVYGRHGGRGHGYPLNHDRDLPTSNGPYGGSRNHHLSLQESRSNGQVSDQDSVFSHPRRRIPVAVCFTLYK